jgi:negative regulator of flagellin synthesis FlgM
MSNVGQIKNAAALNAVTPQDRKTPGSAKQAAGARPAEVEASAQVEISPAASALSDASEDPSFDSAKVEALAQAIKDGKFTVNPGAIADKLISNAQELLGRSGSSH